MHILFDQGTPVPLRQFLTDHHVDTAFERGWHLLRNGDLLDVAEANAFDCFITTDQNLRQEQSLTGDEQKAVKTTAFDLQMDPSAPGLTFHILDKAKDRCLLCGAERDGVTSCISGRVHAADQPA